MKKLITSCLIIGTLLSITAEAAEFNNGRWFFIDLKSGEKFALNMERRLGRSQASIRVSGKYYGQRLLPYADMHNKTLQARVGMNSRFSLSFQDTVLLTGKISDDGDSIMGTFADGARFIATRSTIREKGLWQLCRNEPKRDYKWSCVPSGAFYTETIGVIGCSVAPYRDGLSTFYTERECQENIIEAFKNEGKRGG